MRLAFADALDFRRVQRIGLAPALAAVLGEHATRQAERLGEGLAQLRVVAGPPRDVADHAAQIGLQLAQCLVGALELMRMGVTLVLDQRQLADADVGLAQAQSMLLRQPHQPLTGAIEQLGVGGEHHRLRLHGGIDDDARQILRPHGLRPRRHRKALLQQGLQPILAHALAPARQGRAIEG